MVNVKTAELLIGDPHLGEGHGRYEVFLDKSGLARQLEAWVPIHLDAEILRLVLTGDDVDFRSICYQGRWGIIPTEAAALDRTEKCLTGNPEFWGAITRFHEDSRARTVILIGNHDSDLSWPSVQAYLAQALSPADPTRVSFKAVDRIDKILITHGDGFNLLYANRPAPERFCHGPDGTKLKVPFNVRFSIGIVAWLKRRCWPLGYLAHHSSAWFLGLIRSSRILSAASFYLATFKLRRYLVDHPEILTVVAGHTHLAGIWVLRLKDGRHVTYLNNGTAMAQVRPWRFWRGHYTEWTPVEIVRIGSVTSVRLLRFDPVTATFSDWT